MTTNRNKRLLWQLPFLTILIIGTVLIIRQQHALLRAAGFALSDALLEDIIFRACLMASIYDLDRVNVILETHGVPPFPSEGD